MQNRSNLRIYRWWAPFYDLVIRPVYRSARQCALSRLNVQAGERVLIPGVGTGQDLEWLPAEARITAIDLSPDMLKRAHTKTRGRSIHLAIMDAQNLSLADHSFDAIVFNLILSVVPDGSAAFRETWRVLRPGGRAVIFDKFLPETEPLSPARRVIGKIITAVGTDPNRRLSEIIGVAPGIIVERNEPSLLHGQYRIILLRKAVP